MARWGMNGLHHGAEAAARRRPGIARSRRPDVRLDSGRTSSTPSDERSTVITHTPVSEQRTWQLTKKAPTWQRIASGVLAAGVVWAFAMRGLNGELDTGLRVGSTLGALYGGYLFGYSAFNGRLPGMLRKQVKPPSQNAGDA